MRKYLYIITILHLATGLIAQTDTLNFSKDQYNNLERLIFSFNEEWQFRSGTDSSGLRDWTDTAAWQNIPPAKISWDNMGGSKYLEGWFRVLIRLDSTLKNETLYLDIFSEHGAYDVYIDKDYVYSIGNTGIINEKEYKQANTKYKEQMFELPLEVDTTYQLSVFYRLERLHPFLRNIFEEKLTSSFRITLAKRNDRYIYLKRKMVERTDLMVMLTLYLIIFILFGLFWLIINRDRIYGLISLIALVFCVGFISQFILPFEDYNPLMVVQNLVFDMVGAFIVAVLILFLSFALVLIKSKHLYRIILGSAVLFFVLYITISDVLGLIFIGISFAISITLLLIYFKRLIGAKKFIMYGFLSTLLFGLLLLLMFNFDFIPRNRTASIIFNIGFTISFPLGLFVFLTAKFKEMLEEVRTKSDEIVRVNQEKRIQAENMNVQLEKKVATRTQELSQSLDHLKSTQAQLIQSEKMASLGELTAGIAHEIQNPLNFVNNFSEVNNEMLEEVEEELESGEIDEAKAIITDLKSNMQKITHHGQRASGIVRSMLDHSRTSSGEKVETDINALCDEYLRLAYHGMRAKDRSFNAELVTNFDESLPKVQVIPQDIGRVLLNLINNAFQAVSDGVDLTGLPDKKEDTSTEDPASSIKSSTSNLAGLGPKVEITTKKENEYVIITVSDNGPGIPDDIKDKIFQPFFTTKPTGEGTGLGLSLSYDIIKAHGGEMRVQSGNNQGAEFVILIPI